MIYYTFKENQVLHSMLKQSHVYSGLLSRSYLLICAQFYKCFFSSSPDCGLKSLSRDTVLVGSGLTIECKLTIRLPLMAFNNKLIQRIMIKPTQTDHPFVVNFHS